MDRLIEIGKVKTYKSNEIAFSKIGTGMEKLDRDVFDPNKVYDKVQNSGVKYVRLQSGWQRTEKVKGVYDFEWLDSIVDNLISRGIEPWFCLCYGNELYSEDANKYFGAVGVPPIHTQKERDAWDNYCRAVAKHYKNRVFMYEVWNEPDGLYCWKHGTSGKEYGEFVIRTSKAIHSVDEEAKIIGGSIAYRNNIVWFEDAMKTGMGDYVWAITYHDYSPTETRVRETCKIWKAIIDKYNPNVKLIQGEAGCPSSSKGHGALMLGAWTEQKQSKMVIRRLITDLTTPVEFCSWFTSVDMIEALHGKKGDVASYLDYGYFGFLRALFDENGKSIGEYNEKPSFYALRNVCSIFKDEVVPFDLPIICTGPDYTERVFGLTERMQDIVVYGFKNKKNNSYALAYYKPTDLMTISFEGLMSFIADMDISEMRLVDLMDGKVYKLPEKMIEEMGSGVYRLKELPIKDYPMLLTFGKFFEEE